MINIANKLTELGFIVKKIQEGKVNRCSTIYQPNKKNGWFRIFDNSVSYGDWSGNIENNYFWLDEKQPLTLQEKQDYIKKRLEIEQQQKIIDEEDRKHRLEEVRKAHGCTKTLSKVHTYLERKKIAYRDDFTFDYQNRLVIPIFNIHNQLVGYQYINDEGEKKFKSGSITKEGFYIFKPYQVSIKELDLIFICEGVATAGSVYQCLNEELDAINYGVIATFSAGNVRLVIDSISQIVKRKNIVGISDNDDAGINAYFNINIPHLTCGIQTGHDANDIAIQFGEDKLAELIIDFLNNL